MHTFSVALISSYLALAAAYTMAASPLHWDVYLAPPVPVNDTLVPGLSFSPTAFTLIHGDHTAILVDVPPTIATTLNLATWIEATIPNKTLTRIYITHGHGDHFLGLPVLQARFPGVQALATPHSIEHIKQQLEPETFDGLWKSLFPGQLAVKDGDELVISEVKKEFEIEGNMVRVVEVGQSDTYATTVLHVPALELVVTGDVVYGKCFQYMAESNNSALRNDWIAAIDKVERLNVKYVVPSHMQAGDGFGTDHFERTKEYVRTWGRELEEGLEGKRLEEKMKMLFPGRIGDFILKFSVQGGIPTF